MRYVIVKGDRDTVCDGVRGLLSEGWELHGNLIALEPTRKTNGVTGVGTVLTDRFAQAMTKEASNGR